MPWSTADLIDAIAQGLRDAARDRDLEQAVYGIDSLDELSLHPLIHHALTRAGYGAWREQRYPGDWALPKRSQGQRCDLVLTPDGLPIRDIQVRGTLFETQPGVDPERAYWLEIKTVAQFEPLGPARGYSRELLSPVVDDIRKLWADGVIAHAGLLLVLFNADQHTAEHDLHAWHDRVLDRGCPAGTPATRGFPLTDRAGNAWCSASLFPVRGV
jgi:hypothetical protein